MIINNNSKHIQNPSNNKEINANSNISDNIHDNIHDNKSNNNNELPIYNARNTLFASMTYSSTITQVITWICLLYWICIIVYIYTILARDDYIKESFSIESRLGFLPYFIIIAIYPILYFINQSIHTRLGGYDGRLSNLNPSYPICTKSLRELTKAEKATGAIGKVDYRCRTNITNFNADYGNMIIGRTYYIIRCIFTLILFLFTQRAGKFKNSIVTSNSKFITVLIQNALFLGLILLSSSIFLRYYYFTTFVIFFFMNLLQMLGAITIMLIGFILYRLIYLYV